MDSYQDTRRQLRVALAVVLTVIPIGVFGFMLLERLNFLDAVWLTVITLATIGYGDVYARTEAGRVFTIMLVLVGLGTVAYGLQATASFLLSPVVRDLRQRRRIERAIGRIQHHFIICGAGELVDDTIRYLQESAAIRYEAHIDRIAAPYGRILDRLLYFIPTGKRQHLHSQLRALVRIVLGLFHRRKTLLDQIVVVTPAHKFADHLRQSGLMVLEGDPSSNDVLLQAGNGRARALIVILNNDVEALLTILSARSLNPSMEITVAALEEALVPRMFLVGASSVITPYNVAGQFLNMSTLRPAVNEFFSSIMFSQRTDFQAVPLPLQANSPWIGQTIKGLRLHDRFQAGIIGLRDPQGELHYAPAQDHHFEIGEIPIAVLPTPQIESILADSLSTTLSNAANTDRQRIPQSDAAPRGEQAELSPEEAANEIQHLTEHYVICGSGRIARSAISRLDPGRPFVIITPDSALYHELLQQGFRAIHGSPIHDSILQRAAIDRALALMITIDDDATSVMAVLSARALSKRVLITATAHSDDMVRKLQRAGADRVVTPYRVAAQYMLLASTRPVVSDFLRHILFNYSTGLETTELYVQDSSPWIGRTIQSLELANRFNAGVIGIRLTDGRYQYAPSGEHVLARNEVLIVVTPMQYADLMRMEAHGGSTGRPASLRRHWA